MEKKKYITPSLEVEKFKTASVLTDTSENSDTVVDLTYGREF